MNKYEKSFENSKIPKLVMKKPFRNYSEPKCIFSIKKIINKNIHYKVTRRNMLFSHKMYTLFRIYV